MKLNLTLATAALAGFFSAGAVQASPYFNANDAGCHAMKCHCTKGKTCKCPEGKCKCKKHDK